MSKRVLRLVPNLAVADLWREWILTLCLVLAIAAVVAPLLVLQGLKYGTVSTLRDRLVQDPAYRELRPAATKEYKPEWFQELASAPSVGFLLPTVLPASSILSISHPSSGRWKNFDLIPTGDGDSLLLENGGLLPGEGECVLTAAAASVLGVGIGQMLSVRATRSRGGTPEFGTSELRVVAILDARAGTLPRVYAPLQFVLDVEGFKEGHAVSGRGWSGDFTRPSSQYDGAFVLLERALDSVELSGLALNTGLAGAKKATVDEVHSSFALELPQGWYGYILNAAESGVSESSMAALKRKLRGKDAVVLPFVDSERLGLSGLPENRVLVGLSLNNAQASRLGWPAPPWGANKVGSLESEKLRQIWVPKSLVDSVPSKLEISSRGITELRFPVSVRGDGPEADALFTPVELLGVLRAGIQRPLFFEGGSFRVGRTGFRGFRLYAKTIDDVPPLVKRLRAEGIEVKAREDDIQRIQVLDRGLARLFWLIASLGVSGGAAVLVASLYAAVQRKRRQLAVMRLMGFTRIDVFAFPIYQGAFLAVLGAVVAICAYAVLSVVINSAFSDDLDLGQQICTLPTSTLYASVVMVIVVALIGSSLAAWETTRIDPAEAIREE